MGECSMGKRSEGNPHAAFDEGEGGEFSSPLCYSTGLYLKKTRVFSLFWPDNHPGGLPGLADPDGMLTPKKPKEALNDDLLCRN